MKIELFKYHLARALRSTRYYSDYSIRLIMGDLDDCFLREYARESAIEDARRVILSVYTEMDEECFSDLMIDFSVDDNDFWELDEYSYLVKEACQ